MGVDERKNCRLAAENTLAEEEARRDRRNDIERREEPRSEVRLWRRHLPCHCNKYRNLER